MRYFISTNFTNAVAGWWHSFKTTFDKLSPACYPWIKAPLFSFSGQTSHSPLRPFWLSLSRTMKFNILVKPYQKTGHLDRNVRFELFGIEKIVIWEGSMRWNRMEIMIKRDSLQKSNASFFDDIFVVDAIYLFSVMLMFLENHQANLSAIPCWLGWFNRRSNGGWWFIHAKRLINIWMHMKCPHCVFLFLNQVALRCATW